MRFPHVVVVLLVLHCSVEVVGELLERHVEGVGAVLHRLDEPRMELHDRLSPLFLLLGGEVGEVSIRS